MYLRWVSVVAHSLFDPYCGSQDLQLHVQPLSFVGSSSLIRDQTQAPWIGTVESLATGPTGKFKKTISFTTASKKNKGLNLIKEVKDLHIENCKTLMK